MNSSQAWLFAATTAFLASAIGCGSSDGPQIESQPPATAHTIADPAPDPTAQLRQIGEKGKEKAPTSAGEGYTFIDVRVEAVKSSSLTYPYIGRIIADYKSNEYGHIDRCVVYFKYDGNEWVFAKYDRGGSGGSFPGPLTEDQALSPSSVSEFNSPNGAAPKFTIWLPLAA